MPWTRNQEAAIKISGKNILVSAAAGSGKTAVLVERIISRILDEELSYSIDDLLIMTFTRAAAAGMKERIKKSLEKALEKIKEEKNFKEYKRIKKQISILDTARISTIDSFCMSIVKDNIDRLDLDAAFNIASEEDLELLRSDVMEELMEEEYEKASEDFLFLLDVFAKARGDDGLISNIEKVYKHSMSLPWPDKYLKKQENGGFSFEEIEKELYEEAKEILISASKSIDTIDGLALLDEALNKVLYGATDKKKSTLGVYNKENNEKDCIKAALNTKDIYEMKEILETINFHTLRMGKSVDEDIAAEVKSLREEYKCGVNALRVRINTDRAVLVKEEEFSLTVTKALLRLVREYSLRLKERKLEKKLLDFNDVAHYALKVLWKDGEKTDVALQYASEFKEIYVDEYQDSNYIQEELVKAVERDNVFMVGDVKQSIYGFRQAKPELFISKYNSFCDYEEAKKEDKDVKIILSDNFRSRAGVLESINSIFYRIMSKEVGNIVYDSSAALNPAASYIEDETKKLPGKTLLCYLNTAELDENTKKEYKGMALEAKLIAKTIENLMHSDMFIQDASTLRPLEYRDIVILMRNTKNKANIIVEELTDRGIPCYANAKTGFFDTFEIQKFLAFLSAIDNPSLEVPLCAYLKSPIINIDDEVLAVLAGVDIIGERDIYKTLKYIVDIFATDNDAEKLRIGKTLGEENVYKIRKAFEYLKKYREQSFYIPLHILIRNILTETHFMDYISAMPYGDIRSANLLILAEKAKSYEESGYSGLFNFIRYISDLKEQNTDFGEASLINENANTVRVMTIHASKGLEYPACILADLAASFGSADIRDKMLIDDKYGLSFTYTDIKRRIVGDSTKKLLAKEKIKENQRAEELRLLYVAMTRAKELLILTSCFNEDNKLKEYGFLNADEEKALSKHYIKSAGSYLDWIFMTKTANERFIEYRKMNFDELEKLPENCVPKSDTGAEQYNDSIDFEALKAGLNFRYKFEEDTKIANKYSVSELKRKNQDIKDAYLRYNYDDSPEGGLELPSKTVNKYKASDRGNAYHKFMDLLDFEALDRGMSLKEVVKELKQKSKMSEDDLKLIKMKDIEKLLNSEIGKLMKKACIEKRLFREQEFYAGLSAKELNIADSEELVVIQGVVDAYIEDEDEVTIIDYKTDRVRSEEEFLKRYSEQLKYYAIAISKATGKKIKDKLIWSFELGKEIRCID